MGMWENQYYRNWAVVELKSELGCVRTNKTGTGEVGENVGQ
jgi:hypothetical protein